MPIGHKAVVASHQGLIRPNNEDRAAYFTAPQGTLWMVCDGMGGHAAGEKAAELAIQAAIEFLQRTDKALEPRVLIERILYEANEAIFKMAQLHPQYRRMGTTCVVAFRPEGQTAVYYGHVGDSRLYWYTKDHLRQLTLDHSYVQLLISQGLLSPEEAAFHPRRNIILRALGLSARPEPEVAPEPILPQSGDLLLLCSDGLTNMVSEADIQRLMTLPLPLQQRADQLIEAANAAGGEDNVTVILVEFAEEPSGE